MPGPDQPIELVTAASNAVDELTTLYRHILGRLAVAVEEVEKVLGLPPLERTKPDE